MDVVSLTHKDFDKAIQEHDCVVVDFWASWCGPCKMFEPTYKKVSEKHPDVLFAKVDIEEEQQLAQDFQVRSIPYVMVFRGEFAVYAESGTQTQQSLNDIIEQAKKIDLDELRQSVQQKGTPQE